MNLILALTVVFHGIISQVDLPSKETVAVIPNAPHHEPYLCVQSADIVTTPLPAASYIEAPDASRKACPEYRVNLKGVKVTLEGIDETAVTRTADYTKYTLPLSKISSCKKLKPDVEKKQHDAGGEIDAYVEYPGGTLDAGGDFFGTTATIKGSEREPEQCYACSVKLTMKAKKEEATIRLSKNGQGLTFNVKGSAVLQVVNGTVSKTSKGHSMHHYKIFEKCGGKVPANTFKPCKDKKICPQSMQVTAHNAELKKKASQPGKPPKKPDYDVECTGSNFP